MQGGAIQAHKSLWHSKSTVSNLDTLAMRFCYDRGNNQDIRKLEGLGWKRSFLTRTQEAKQLSQPSSRDGYTIALPVSKCVKFGRAYEVKCARSTLWNVSSLNGRFRWWRCAQIKIVPEAAVCERSTLRRPICILQLVTLSGCALVLYEPPKACYLL